MSSHYAVLGVGRKASIEEIPRAYRKRVKETHPDAGGDRQEFDKVTRALQVLSDPERRDRYDRGGDDSERPPEEVEALHMLSSDIQMAIQACLQNPRINLIDQVKGMLEQKLREIHRAIEKAEREVKDIEKVKGRLTRKAGVEGEDFINGIFEGQIRILRSQVEQGERVKRIAKRTEEILEQYQYQPDETAPVPGNFIFTRIQTTSLIF